MLEFDETMDLIVRAQQGSDYAKEKLIIENTPLIKSIVRRYAGKNVEYEDLMQLGAMGLVKAINNFDVSFNVQFSTYAVPMIAGEIKRFMRDDGAIKVSRAIKSLNIKINKYIDEYKQENNSEPTIQEISNHFNISPQEVVFVTDSSKIPVSIYENVDSENENELLDCIPGVDNTEKNIYKILLKDIINDLPDREKKIILLRYFRDMTQSEIAQIFGVSQVQISRIESKVLEKMRKAFEVKI
ncbi:MAG: SigB/SigF/SigG family RNA polymerase sigma factor [Clostridia bacterium]|nr:SigB/SigF/SigG family RNA polymerase sigma factor [Clostridia bacterium]